MAGWRSVNMSFANGRLIILQILFYANAGQSNKNNEDGSISLFLKCEVATHALRR